jgi:exopolyphosphatase/guanosine-5'-triphosphate,3'-diphosphate pyrophosphatase
MVGLAGTISTLASIDLKLDNYDREKIHSHILKFEKVMELYHKLLTLNLKERKKIKGLEPKRADIIIAGTAILIEIMNMTGVQELFVSENDILDGIIYSIF